MALPPLAPFPPRSFRMHLAPEEWEACLDAWITLAGGHLNLSDQKYSAAADSLAPFLQSYFHSLAATKNNSLNPKEIELRRDAFLLSHRLLSQSKIPPDLLKWEYLADLSHAFPRNRSLQGLFQSVWKRKGDALEAGLQDIKKRLISWLDSNENGLAQAEETLSRLAPLWSTSSDTAAFFMTGSDFLDSLMAAYTKASNELRSKLAISTFMGLQALSA
ncbi:hypothetical protein LTS18_000156, partial [Coniosporium uncinatum]